MVINPHLGYEERGYVEKEHNKITQEVEVSPTTHDVQSMRKHFLMRSSDRMMKRLQRVTNRRGMKVDINVLVYIFNYYRYGEEISNFAA